MENKAIRQYITKFIVNLCCRPLNIQSTPIGQHQGKNYVIIVDGCFVYLTARGGNISDRYVFIVIQRFNVNFTAVLGSGQNANGIFTVKNCGFSFIGILCIICKTVGLKFYGYLTGSEFTCEQVAVCPVSHFLNMVILNSDILGCIPG